MKRIGSFLWIVFLLAALFLGPALILDRTVVVEVVPSLRASIQQERLLDSPAPLPDPAPDDR